MSATPYVPLSWNPDEPTSTDKLNLMTNNDQWLFENTPRALYTKGSNRTAGIKFLGGMAIIPASKTYHAYVNVNFGSFFTAGCIPIITTGVLSYPHGRIMVNHRGLGTFWPDQRGIELHAISNSADVISKSKIYDNCYVNYIAMGW